MSIWRPQQNILVKARGLVWRDGLLLASEIYLDDGSIKGVRPLGGRLEFGETWRDALVLGLWQAVAFPGTSRSGITITGALRAGFTRTEAARISMLMSIPTILASGTLTALDLIGGTVPVRDTSIVIAFSFGAAFLALCLMMRLLNTLSYTPYVIYRVLLGLGLLAIGYSGSLGF